MRRFVALAATTFALTIVVAALFASFAPGAGAASCGDNTVNVNLGATCTSIVDLHLLPGKPEARTNTCANNTCATAGTPDSSKPLFNAPAPIAPRKHKAAPRPVVLAAPAPERTFRINAFDAAPGDSFYSGDFRLRLPYPPDGPDVGAPVPSVHARWSVPELPLQAVLFVAGGLMLLASAGGVKRMIATL